MTTSPLPATISPDRALAHARPAGPTLRAVPDLVVTGSRPGAVDDLATRHVRGVSALLQARPDLRGVHAFADAVEEAVRWSV